MRDPPIHVLVVEDEFLIRFAITDYLFAITDYLEDEGSWSPVRERMSAGILATPIERA